MINPLSITPSSQASPHSILTIPDELLEQIFYCAVMWGGYGLEGPQVRPLWHIIRVSKRWHSVAMSSPRLWCKRWNLSISNCNHLSDEERDKIFLRAKFFLERSQSHPISFRLGDYSSHGKARLFSIRLLTLVVSHCHQWQDVHLDLAADDALQTLPKIRGNIPLLQELVVELHIPPSLMIKTFDLPCFEEAPLLHTVWLFAHRNDPLVLESTGIRIAFPWHQLEMYVTQTDCYEYGVREALATSNRLLSLVFTERAHVSGATFSEPFTQVRNETLTSLDMRLDVSQSTILPNLLLPSLVDLKICTAVGDFYDSSTLFPAVHDLILRSKCNLRFLSLRASKCSEWELSSILALCEDLETLSLDAPLHVKDVQQLSSDAPPLIPRILKIALRVPFQSQSVEERDLHPLLPALATMAKSRERIRREQDVLGKLHLTLELQLADTLAASDDLCIHILAKLEELPPVSSATTFSMIHRWAQELGELEGRRSLSLRQSYRVHKMLKEMENYQIEGSDLTLLYVSLSRS
ncbi:hypothetical protein MD484_g496, partial [Candolleomyces efflorescens]